jgi:serine/threonine protein kinase
LSQHVFEPRDRCGPYTIERFLASGGIGQVYLARHEYTDRNVALKVLHPVHEQDQRVRRRMQVEARVAAGLRHPNLVTVHDANVTAEGICYIAMELLEGSSLRELLVVRKRLSPADALFIAEKVARGVAAAHEIHVVHRDLKPENIWITDDRQIKVLDFGVAQWRDRSAIQTDPGVALGTPLYMAPEQLLAIVGDPATRPRVGPRADVYALASITHECISGKPVWLRETISEMTTPPRSRELLMWHAVRTPVSLARVVPGLPEVASALIASALERDPERRPRSMADFAVQLRRARLACLERYPDVELLLDSDGEQRRRAYSLPAPGQGNLRRASEEESDRAAWPGVGRARPRLTSAPGVPDDDTADQRAVARVRIGVQGRFNSVFRTASPRARRYWALLALVGVAAPIAIASWFAPPRSRSETRVPSIAGPPAAPEPLAAAASAAATPALVATAASPLGSGSVSAVASAAPPKSPLTAPARPAKPRVRRDNSFFRTMDDP